MGLFCKNSMMEIKNIIFDLGGVILNIDYNLTAQAFKNLGVSNFDELYSKAQQSELFDSMETGMVSNQEFRNGIRDTIKLKLSDEEIDNAWNAMLLDLPSERIELLRKLKGEGYRLFLLSNTNQIHYDAYTKNLKKEHNVEGLEEFFEKTYFSHQIHKRKPLKETFQFVLDDAELNAEETIFIDDSLQHVLGAKEAAINAFHLEGDILAFFDEIEQQNN
jgi:FMN phosphatase YigB (HAD superfamily)